MIAIEAISASRALDELVARHALGDEPPEGFTFARDLAPASQRGRWRPNWPPSSRHWDRCGSDCMSSSRFTPVPASAWRILGCWRER